MAIKQFKTESKRLLDLMANSIYTNTDIFLRELISNASDALDKRYFMSLKDTSINADNLEVQVNADSKLKTITISDNGIGMNKDDLENNLGTIARSGSNEFKANLEDNKDVNIIGQFGVGFYSAFMIASKVEVVSKKINEDKAYLWIGTQDGYEIKETNKLEAGTIITLYVKDDTKEKKYSAYLENNKLQLLIKKYSDFIRYPIKMTLEVTDKDGTKNELTTVNSMVPIWKKNKKDIKDEDYKEFYMNTYYDYLDPQKTIHYRTEGNTSYSALLYIPANRPYNFYSTDYKLQLSLYSKGVFIKDDASELISDYFRFVKGVVDSDDLNLNISREILQQDYQMSQLKKSIDKKIKSTLETMLEKERDEYNKFFDNFGAQLKFGAYEKYGANKDVLIDLLMFKSSKEDKYVTLKEYVANMKEDQKEIYYASGESIEQIKDLPQMEKLLDKGYEVLYFIDNVDEFLAQILVNYDSKPFKSIQKGDLDLDSKEEKEEAKKKEEDNKTLLEKIKEILKDEVCDVRLSSRLKSHPVCLVSDDGLSMEMEKVLKQMNQDESIKANKILELNPDHELFISLKKEFDDKKEISEYAYLLYDQATLIAGGTIKDPSAYAKRVADIMIKAMK